MSEVYNQKKARNNNNKKEEKQTTTTKKKDLNIFSGGLFLYLGI